MGGVPATHPDGYGRSRFCELYRAWEGRLSPAMRQAYVAGEKLFVDHAGTTIDIFDATTGEVHTCQFFVAALGASSYTYAEATATQSLPDWIGSHTRAFAFFGGVPAKVVSDNRKSGITKACFYEPAVNRGYAEMAAHCGTVIVPASRISWQVSLVEPLSGWIRFEDSRRRKALGARNLHIGRRSLASALVD